MLDDALAELLARAVAHVLLQDVAQQAFAPAGDIADRKHELVADRAVVHGRACSWFVRGQDARARRLRQELAAAEAAAYLSIATMKPNITYWRAALREAERELEAATTRAAMDAAAKKLMDAKAQLKRLQAKAAAVEA